MEGVGMSELRIETSKHHTSIILDGKDITSKINSYTITENGHGLPAQVTIEHACYDQITIDGEVDVVHVCPKKARSGPDWSTTA